MLSLPLALALLVDPRAGRFDVSGGVVAELRGGYAPVAPNQPASASFLTLITPNIDLRYNRIAAAAC
ncbi:MAG: hypothetical protein U0168_13900 [Nannocystaceae bacterium]